MSTIDFHSFTGGVSTLADVMSSGSSVQPARHGWSYEEAFKRNRGLITEEEQEKLRNSRVAIAGMGGVGGVHLVTLARLGIGNFSIADPDIFELANFNRQFGATLSNLGQNKAEAMARVAIDINPKLDLRVFPDAIEQRNVDTFLSGASLFIDGLDFFAIEARRIALSLRSRAGHLDNYRRANRL